uniref:Colony stimulating factor 3 n=1 Tax=Salvator merianae TaxID=96440 RepID=A0A8D0BP07_SALMN
MYSERSQILSLIGFALWWIMCSAAPLPDFSGDSGFQQFVHKNREFVTKIKGDVSTIKNLLSQAFKFDDSQLLMAQQFLNIKPMDHSLCRKESCDVEGCFSQIQIGLENYRQALSLISEILPDYADQLSSLQADILNLSINIRDQMETIGITLVTYPTAENIVLQNQREIGSYLILHNLQKFMEAIYRALRHCSS